MPAGARSSLRPCFRKGRKTTARLGRISRENAKPCQSEKHPSAECAACWVPALRSVAACRSASGRRERHAVVPTSVIASAAKQSRLLPRRPSGLLRRCAPRNDDCGDRSATNPRSRAPDAAQCALARCAAEPGPIRQQIVQLLGPRSAPQRCTLQRDRPIPVTVHLTLHASRKAARKSFSALST